MRGSIWDCPAHTLHGWDIIGHVNEFEVQAGRRPFSYDEGQLLFDAADGRADKARKHQRKGVSTALRDSGPEQLQGL
ncbi:hypothetical protein [Mycobacterium paraterrae]|uniref:Uncharacterized protein n=1 Tax=Mycobacterium paraterrae TaxID=577492 RepID=A0ABY3VS84_9MYCO|nr:hypothetical protein [Mycobacterium paraterrae]UMB70053.1 hypothetical protein MKK62_01465 [Mycobacterium paraterrae]